MKQVNHIAIIVVGILLGYIGYIIIKPYYIHDIFSYLLVLGAVIFYYYAQLQTNDYLILGAIIAFGMVHLAHAIDTEKTTLNELNL